MALRNVSSHISWGHLAHQRQQMLLSTFEMFGAVKTGIGSMLSKGGNAEIDVSELHLQL